MDIIQSTPLHSFKKHIPKYPYPFKPWSISLSYTTNFIWVVFTVSISLNTYK